MNHVTKQLEGEVGIQYQEAVDKSAIDTPFPIVGVIAGVFRRGPYGKQFKVNGGNVDAIIGHDPENPDYVSVIDMLNSGVPSVSLVRLPPPSPPQVVIP